MRGHFCLLSIGVAPIVAIFVLWVKVSLPYRSHIEIIQVSCKEKTPPSIASVAYSFLTYLLFSLFSSISACIYVMLCLAMCGIGQYMRDEKPNRHERGFENFRNSFLSIECLFQTFQKKILCLQFGFLDRPGHRFFFWFMSNNQCQSRSGRDMRG
jgi:hypothetical protein